MLPPPLEPPIQHCVYPLLSMKQAPVEFLHRIQSFDQRGDLSCRMTRLKDVGVGPALNQISVINALFECFHL